MKMGQMNSKAVSKPVQIETASPQSTQVTQTSLEKIILKSLAVVNDLLTRSRDQPKTQRVPLTQQDVVQAQEVVLTQEVVAVEESIKEVPQTQQVMVAEESINEAPLMRQGKVAQESINLEDLPFAMKERSEISVLKSMRKTRERIKLREPVTVNNLSKHMKEIWLKDRTLSSEQFFYIANKLFSLIQDQKKVLINVNKRWTNRLLKQIRKEMNEDHQPSESSNSETLLRQPHPELHYDMLSETSEESTVANSSDLWKKHTLKLLYERYPQEMANKKRRYRRQGEPIPEPTQEIVVVNESEGEEEKEKESKEKKGIDFWIVNIPMIKTLDNRKEEMLRLQKEAVLLSLPPNQDQLKSRVPFHSAAMKE